MSLRDRLHEEMTGRRCGRVTRCAATPCGWSGAPSTRSRSATSADPDRRPGAGRPGPRGEDPPRVGRGLPGGRAARTSRRRRRPRSRSSPASCPRRSPRPRSRALVDEAIAATGAVVRPRPRQGDGLARARAPAVAPTARPSSELVAAALARADLVAHDGGRTEAAAGARPRRRSLVLSRDLDRVAAFTRRDAVRLAVAAVAARSPA